MGVSPLLPSCQHGSVEHLLKCLPIVIMAPSRSRSVSRGANEDSVKRDNRSKSADRNKSGTKSRSKSLPKSKSRSRSKPSAHRRRSGSRRRSRSRSRGRRSSAPRFRSRSPRRSPENNEGYRLHVADLDEECRKADLEEVFMKYGPLKEIWLASYAPYYAFVVYRDRMDAQDACEGADGVRIAGRRLRVSLAKPR